MSDVMKQLNEAFSMVSNVYFSYFQIEPIDIEIIPAEKISDIYMQKRPDLITEENVIDFEKVDFYKGLIIPPKEIDGKFTVIIRKKYFMESSKARDWQWVGTFTHEMTHVCDFINYARINNLNNYDIVQREFVHRPFVLWTEFHAKAIGYLFIRKFAYGDKYNDMSDRGQTDYILQTELPYHINCFLQRYQSAHGNVAIQLYETMQFMGRYSVWEKLFPNVFNKRVRQQVFGKKPRMDKIYEFLVTHHDLESANKDFDQMLYIIKQNFGSF